LLGDEQKDKCGCVINNWFCIIIITFPTDLY